MAISNGSKILASDVNNHINNKNNPHGVTAAQVGAIALEEMNAAIDEVAAQSVYLSLVGNVNANMVNAALGQNNEVAVKGVGLGLAMYMKYLNTGVILENNFPNLCLCNHITDIVGNLAVHWEIYRYTALWNFLKNNSYTSGKLFAKDFDVSVTGSYSGDGNMTKYIEITSGHLDGTKVSEMTTSFGATKSGSGKVTFNGVVLWEGSNSSSSKTTANLITPEFLATHGITKPGSYPVNAYAHKSTGGSDYYAWTSCTVTSLI